ncbi:MAG: DinB family protein [Blastocatellia bacterium]
MTRPETTEYAPYYEKYIALVADGDIVKTLETQIDATLEVLRSLSEEKGNHRYAPDKWSIKQLVGHLSDTERIFAYRALRIARNDKTPLPGFEQDDFVANADFDSARLAGLADEFAAVRNANIHLLRGFSSEAWLRSGIASENGLSARAAAYIIAGHELYHLDILKTRYLAA